MLKANLFRLGLAGLLILSAMRAASAEEAVALSAQLTGDASRTILSLDLSHPITYKVFALDNPYRVIIDMPAIEFRLPRGSGERSFGVVSDYRYGQVGPGRSRLVINTTGPVLVESAGILSKDGQGPSAFKIALAATDAKTFLAHLPRRPIKTNPVAPVMAATSNDAPTVVDGEAKRKPLVVLDPGHGGTDSGAVGPDGAEEKRVVLAISSMVRQLLLKSGKFDVYMTRDTDVFIPLERRVDIAEQKKADLMVSIHADSTTNSRRWQPVGGATIYVRSTTAYNEAPRVEAFKAIISQQLLGEAKASDEGQFVSNMGMDLALDETKNYDLHLAETAVAALSKIMPMTAEPNRSARFYVLKPPDVPAMLVETGYMNNLRDSPRLQSADGQAKIASGILAAIQSFFDQRAKGGVAAMLPAPVK